MNDSIYRISLDIHEHGSQTVLKAKKTDTGRKLHISLRAGGTPYIIADDCYAVFKATKPDDSILYNACTIENNEIIYEFSEQTCTSVGRCRCEIALYGLDDKLITSPRFSLLVDGTIYPDGRVESADEFSALTELVSETLEVSKSASEAVENATEATKGANDATKSANEATGKANEATQKANVATKNANEATTTATQATEKATQAAQNANTAAGDARNATEYAEETALRTSHIADEASAAADKAIRASTACMVIGKAEDTVISLYDAIEQYLGGLRVFGKTTQNGTPTPDAPVEMVSVGNSGSITVNVNGEDDAQSMTIATPNGLHGIPVTSGGNYTDANGQQWICDEIDFARGMYVQRINKYIYTGKEAWEKSNIQGSALSSAGLIRYDAIPNPHQPKASRADVLSTHCLFAGTNTYNKDSGISTWVAFDNDISYLSVRIAADFDTTEAVKAWLVEQNAAGTPFTILYALATPIETPLSAEEIAAYKALHTYRENTTVSNDAGAWMELEYVMDAKKYIDGLMAGSIAPATVE